MLSEKRQILPQGLSIERKNNDKGYYKENCKWATSTEQNRNKRIPQNNTSGVKGVYWSEQRKRYRIYIPVNGKTLCLGSFKKLGAAQEARKQAEIKYWDRGV